MKEVFVNTLILKRNAHILTLFCVIFLSACAGNPQKNPTEIAADLPQDCPLRFQKVCSAYETIQNGYVERFSDEKLTELFIAGAVKELGDPYSKYIAASDASSATTVANTPYAGIGVHLTKEETPPYALVVQNVYDDGPAFQAGIRRGDRIVEVNGIPIADKTLQESTELIRGENGTKVMLTVERSCNAGTAHFSLTTRPVEDTMSGIVRMIDSHYAYVRISLFEHDRLSAFKVKYSLERVLKRRKSVQGLIIDLRGNPGGNVAHANYFVSLFVKTGDVLYQKFQDGKESPWSITDGRDMLSGAPIVILVNKGTASAAEIVAGAMQDFGRATIVGTQTYGKGITQRPFTLKDGSKLYLTNGYSFTPNRRPIHKIGITPDIKVEEEKNEACMRDLQLAAALDILHKKDRVRVFVAKK